MYTRTRTNLLSAEVLLTDSARGCVSERERCLSVLSCCGTLGAGGGRKERERKVKTLSLSLSLSLPCLLARFHGVLVWHYP